MNNRNNNYNNQNDIDEFTFSTTTYQYLQALADQAFVADYGINLGTEDETVISFTPAIPASEPYETPIESNLATPVSSISNPSPRSDIASPFSIWQSPQSITPSTSNQLAHSNNSSPLIMWQSPQRESFSPIITSQSSKEACSLRMIKLTERVFFEAKTNKLIHPEETIYEIAEGKGQHYVYRIHENGINYVPVINGKSMLSRMFVSVTTGENIAQNSKQFIYYVIDPNDDNGGYFQLTDRKVVPTVLQAKKGITEQKMQSFIANGKVKEKHSFLEEIKRSRPEDVNSNKRLRIT